MTLDGWQSATLQLVGFFTAARLVELGTSALRTRTAYEEHGARPAHESWWPAFIAVHAFVLVGTATTILYRGTMPPRWVLVPALGALALATALRGWLFFTLRDRWNVRVIDPGPGGIVTNGPYRFIRHPNYLAVILEVAALPLIVGAWEVALVGTIANALVLARRIPFEEAFLAARHPVYRDVLMRRPRFVPRAIIPAHARPHEGGSHRG